MHTFPKFSIQSNQKTFHQNLTKALLIFNKVLSGILVFNAHLDAADRRIKH